jgi:uncharacterized protein
MAVAVALKRAAPRRALLDVNVLIALVDPKHGSSARAHEWFAANQQAKGGVATCPIVQNGVARILSQPTYSSAAQFSVQSVVQVLRDFCATVDHQFWADSIALVNAETFDETRLMGHRQITDAYLLALAVANDGMLVTFDSAIAATTAVVRGASSEHVLVL